MMHFCVSTGHRQAYEIGILHRDVSEGNVTIVDGKPFKGFLHDFDYSSFYKKYTAELEENGELPANDTRAVETVTSPDSPEDLIAFFAADLPPLDDKSISGANHLRVTNELKERTVSMPALMPVLLLTTE